MNTILNANEKGATSYGADQLFKNNLYPFQYTDGVANFAKASASYWFLDIISSHQNRVCWISETSGTHKKVVLNNDFQVWKLERNLKADLKGNVIERKDSFRITCEDGDGNVLKTQHIEFSDFEYDTYTVWLKDKILLLPSEY